MGWRVELVARIGWTSRDAWWAITQDPRVWAGYRRPGPWCSPSAAWIPCRRRCRRHCVSSCVTSVRRRCDGSFAPATSGCSRGCRSWPTVALPPRLSVEYLESCRDALAAIRPDLPVIGTYPSVHRCDAYGRVHAGREPAVRALEAWSAQKGVPMVDLAAAVRDNVFSDHANPDGIHWGWDAHEEVAAAMIDAIKNVRRPVPSTESGAE